MGPLQLVVSIFLSSDGQTCYSGSLGCCLDLDTRSYHLVPRLRVCYSDHSKLSLNLFGLAFGWHVADHANIDLSACDTRGFAIKFTVNLIFFVAAIRHTSLLFFFHLLSCWLIELHFLISCLLASVMHSGWCCPLKIAKPKCFR